MELELVGIEQVGMRCCLYHPELPYGEPDHPGLQPLPPLSGQTHSSHLISSPELRDPEHEERISEVTIIIEGMLDQAMERAATQARDLVIQHLDNQVLPELTGRIHHMISEHSMIQPDPNPRSRDVLLRLNHLERHIETNRRLLISHNYLLHALHTSIQQCHVAAVPIVLGPPPPDTPPPIIFAPPLWSSTSPGEGCVAVMIPGKGTPPLKMQLVIRLLRE